MAPSRPSSPRRTGYQNITKFFGGCRSNWEEEKKEGFLYLISSLYIDLAAAYGRLLL
ncbi:hypothetical protein C4D60_Mb05t25590 [Musa balbisiana]|uniref:Uncharacterized protein n=1 Tax=Musa balbisiana TaxID=52838 RepID=A0A4S8JYU5_MUSBA|nr:hypothetical protein C4D60_Mb05t25590 [Musa balbisiana]